MSDEIEIWLTTPTGTRVIPLAHYDRLNYTRAVNAVGELEIVLPGEFDSSLVRIDGLILVSRNGRLETETAWLVREVKRATDANGVRKVTLTAVSGNDLLRRRIVLSASAVTAAADDQIKRYVRESLSTSATDAARRLPATLFAVAADVGGAPGVTFEADRLNLLTVCQDLAKAAAEMNTPLFFDVVYLPENSLWELRTYTGARGVDKGSTSGAPVTLSVESGSVGADTLDDNYRGEVTVVYAGGRGEGAGRLSTTVEDATRSGRSVYGRHESFTSSSTQDSAELTAESRAALQRGRPTRTYDATAISTSASRYGRDWTFGDVLAVNAYGLQINCRLDAVQVTIDNLAGGRETIRARLTNTEAL